MQKTGALYNGVSAGFAFFLWAFWAYYVNATAKNQDQRWISAIAQGTFSMIMTLVMIRVIAFLFARYRDEPRPKRVIFPPALTVACSGSLLTLVHIIVGTPELLLTVSFPLGVALGFCIVTTLKLEIQYHRSLKS